MKVLLTVVSLDPERGAGVAERNRRLASHLAAQGHDCQVITIEDGALREELEARGVRVLATSALRLVFQVPLVNPVRLVRIVRGVDAVHLTGYWNLLTALTALVAVLLRKPYVLSPAGEFAALDGPRPAPKAFHLLIGRHVVHRASLLVAITALEASQMRVRFGLSASRVVVVSNGVEPVVPGAGRVRLPDRPFVVFMGRLAPLKGPDLLVRAFARIAQEDPELDLLMAGPDSGMGEELRELVTDLGLEDRVHFPGHLDESDRTTAYRRALLLAIPSRSEAMSLVALEAGIVGLPVLLTDRCGFDAVGDVGGGLVVPASVEGLADGLRTMLSARDDLPASGEKLRALVIDNYGWPEVVAGLVAHLEGLVEPRRPVEDE